MFHLFAPFRLFRLFAAPASGDPIVIEPTESEPACALRTADDAGIYTRDGLYLCPQL